MSKIKDIIMELNLSEEQLKDKEIQKFVLQVAYRKQAGKFYQYWNGNGYCEINKEDGTMITTVLTDEEFKPDFPNNCDINISNCCNMGCKFCYQGCTLNGKHADIRKFINDKNSFLYSLHPGTELAINGNEPFHPDLELLLTFCKERNILANLTVNEVTLVMHTLQLEKWLNDGLLHGIGISPSMWSIPMVDFCSSHPTTVIHTIAGITTKEQYEALKDKNIKVLILGYKEFGRGVTYFGENQSNIDEERTWLKNNIKDLVNHFTVLSFDNLAIEQLDPKSWLSKKDWERFYRGADGHHTLFIDLVNETFAKNSVQSKENHKPLMNNISDMLKNV